MTGRNRFIRSIFAPVFIGAIGLFNLMGKPRFQTFHSVDVLQLIASGMCFGVGLAALFLMIRGPRTQ
jgi:formate/nitrite transporter FocA (FNT family)